MREKAISATGDFGDWKECRIQGDPSVLSDKRPESSEKDAVGNCSSMQSSPGILYDPEKGSRLQWGKDVTGYPKAWKEHQGSIRNPDIQKEPAVVEANCRYAKQTDSWLQPRRKKEGWNCEKQTERERKTSTGDSAVTGSRSVNVMFTKNEPVVGRYNHHRAGP